MPRPSKGAHLYLRRRAGRPSCWVIRDGDVEDSTGCSQDQHREAEKKFAAYLATKHRPTFGDGDPARIPVADVLNLYVKERAPLTASPERVAYAVAPLSAFWGDKMVEHVTSGGCQDYVAWRTAQPITAFKDPAEARRVGAQTARRELAVLSAALGYAHKEKKLKYKIALELPEKTSPRTRWLTRAEAARLLWASWRSGNRHLARFVLVALYTGGRHDAVVRLRWLPSVDAGWVDLDQELIFRKGAGESESSKRRPPVAISPRLAAHLRRWQTEGGAYVVTWGGLPVAKIRRAWNTARQRAGLGTEVTPHILRHTFASWGIQAGSSFAEVATAIGTTEQIVREVYGHLAPDYLRGVVANVSGYRGRQRGGSGA
jgi:integrase